jgi:hypothetical protein
MVDSMCLNKAALFEALTAVLWNGAIRAQALRLQTLLKSAAGASGACSIILDVAANATTVTDHAAATTAVACTTVAPGSDATTVTADSNGSNLHVTCRAITHAR